MSKADILADAKKRFKEAMDGWSANRKAWLEDTKFLEDLDQWPEAIKKARNVAGQERPCLVVDKLGQYVKQIVNDGRQNRPAVKVRPVEDGDEEVAEAYQGIIRHICDRSRADQAFDTALQHAVVGGFGFFRVCTEYAHDETFNQEIVVKRVRNPLSILLDPNAMEADGSDARYGFVIEEVPKDEFENRYPSAEVTDWESEKEKLSDGWMDEKNVRVCEYFYKEEEPVTLYLLADGTTASQADYDKAVTETGMAPPVKDKRTVKQAQVKWCKLTGVEVLEETDWLGQYIPIIPVYGDEYDIEGKVYYRGLIRRAKDAQRLYNFSRSAFAERVAMSPKAPFMAADEAIEGKGEWKTANSGNHQVLRYKAFDSETGQALPQPTRIAPADVPAGYSEDMQLSEHDIQGALGMYNSSLGEKSNEKSGRAIMARQREGDTATFHFQDNQSRAIGYLGRILVDAIPKYLDSPRAIRMLGEDGEVTPARIDPEQPDPVHKNGDVSIYNLNAGKYDVSVSSGPSYTTKRQEALDAGMQLLQANPQAWQLIGDIIIRNADWPGSDEIADRFKKMLPPQLQEGPESLPPEIHAAMQQIEQQKQEMMQAHAQLTEMAQQVAQDKAMTDAQKVKLESLAKEIDAKDKILQANYQELSAKIELQAMKLATPPPQQMPPGQNEPAINPDNPAPAGFVASGA